jgi:uncharacterized protein YndB with AHSA1/START domain
MPIHTGYLLIADISGYTAFLTSSEQEHATQIMRGLLSALVEQVGDPLHLWRLEGDAVLAYSTRQTFPSGETFLSICENLYVSFALHRQNVIANTTCVCRACANVSSLDLKIMLHYGTFEEIQIGPMNDISGADVILVHRMSKTDVGAATGIGSYALFSEAAAQAMNVQSALVPFVAAIEHFGDVPMQVYDLSKAWEHFRADQERHFLTEADGIYTFHRMLKFPRAVVWEALVAPELKRQWMGLIDTTVDRPDGRIGLGSGYHCIHEVMEFRYWVTDWRPFDYFSTRMPDPLTEGPEYGETYAFSETDEGTLVRYTLSPGYDSDGNRRHAEEKAVADFLASFWPPVFDELERLLATATAPANP